MRKIINNPMLFYSLDTYQAYLYARDTIKRRCHEAETIIISNPDNAYEYAYDVIKGRWQEAEPYIRMSIYEECYTNFYGCDLLK